MPHVHSASGAEFLVGDHGKLQALSEDGHTQYPYIITSTDAPTVKPYRVGLIHVDTSTGKMWVSVAATKLSDWRATPAFSYLPYAIPLGSRIDGSVGVATVTLAANGGSIATPVVLASHMLLQSVSIRNTNTATQRTWGWDLYVQDNNSGSSGENTLRRVAASTADETFTPSAASTRSIDASGAPVFLEPGVYWLVAQNRHASNSFDIGCDFHSGVLWNRSQTKTTTNPNGATLDFVAATWTKTSNCLHAILKGRVFGETASF